jgi:hypothetical protein
MITGGSYNGKLTCPFKKTNSTLEGLWAPANVLLYFPVLFPRGSGALAFLSSFFSFPFDAGLFKEFSAAKLRQNTFLLHSFIEPPQ